MLPRAPHSLLAAGRHGLFPSRVRPVETVAALDAVVPRAVLVERLHITLGHRSSPSNSDVIRVLTQYPPQGTSGDLRLPRVRPPTRDGYQRGPAQPSSDARVREYAPRRPEERPADRCGGRSVASPPSVGPPGRLS